MAEIFASKTAEIEEREVINAQISRKLAGECMVLLENDGALPIHTKKVALFGNGARATIKGGTGSGDVNTRNNVNIEQGFQNAGIEVMTTAWLDRQEQNTSAAKAAYVQWMKEEAARKQTSELAVMFDHPYKEPDCEIITINDIDVSETDTAVYVIARNSGEGADRFDEEGDYRLYPHERGNIHLLAEVYDKLIVVLNIGGVMDLSEMRSIAGVNAILLMTQLGNLGGDALLDVLTGKVNPSGKTTDTWAENYMDYPSSAKFSHNESVHDEMYEDGIYVGYRYFDSFGVKPLYCFGYGKSYTDFEIKAGKISVEGNEIQIPVTVKNTGKIYAGKEVVQVYIAKPQGKLGKPAKELAAFEKTRELQPGESQLMILTWEINDMASYDDLGKVKKSAYVLEAGSYDIYVGTSVRDVTKADYSYILNHDVITEQLSAKLVPTSLPKRMLADGSYEALPQSEPVDTDYSAIGNIDPSLTEGVAPGQRAIPYFRFADGMAKNGSHDIMDVVEGRITLDEFVSELSIDDLIHLLGGQPNTGVANTFGIGNMPEYGIPSVMTADGPAGVRIAPEVGICTTAFPCSTLLACTWNPDVLEAVGRAGGEELKENNLALWLTPAICIHRSPLCGRNFEYYSEDPFVTGKLAGAMVRGIQSNNVGATVKHFALNNKETNRKNSDSRVSERAAREIYLKAFEMIVKDENPWAIMSSYNMINGYRASESEDLLTGILRDEWGYDGHKRLVDLWRALQGDKSRK